jgi:hypothetical protein
MSPRRVSAVLCLAGAVMIAWGVFLNNWWWVRISRPEIVVDVKIGLVSFTGCRHDDAGVWRCASVDWKQIGVPAESAAWIWSGRLLFGVALATAAALALAAVRAAVPIEGSLPVSPARLALGFGVAALVLLGLYRFTTPDGVKLLMEWGKRAWLLPLGGLVIGAVGAGRELDPDD